MNVVSIDLNGKPSAVLLSYYYARMFIGSGWASWAQLRCGIIEASEAEPEFPVIPPSNEVTERAIYVGDPLGGLEYARGFSSVGLKTVLLALGVDEDTLPIPPWALGQVEAVMAPSQTAAWLRRCGCPDVVEVPLPFALASEDVAPSEGKDMEIVKTARVRLPPLPFYNRVHDLVLADNGTYASPVEVKEKIQGADVVVTRGLILDDPVRSICERLGVPVVPMTPEDTLPDRMVEAARDRRQRKVQVSHLDGLASGEWVEDVERVIRGDYTRQEPPSAPAPLGAGEIGIVIPFGGTASEEELEEVLEHISGCLRDGGLEEAVSVMVGHLAADELEMSNIREIVVEGHGALYRGRTDGAEGWSISRARNVGLWGLDPQKVAHVMFFDVDIRTTPEALSDLIGEAKARPHQVLSPYVRQESGYVRIGSGVSLFPIEALNQAGGFDESYIGWGAEDIELLSRLRERHGVLAWVTGDPIEPPLRHLDHDDRA